MNKTDTNWTKLFDKYNILTHINTNGFFEISSTQINEFREARLMTKFDHKSNLPKLFKDNNLSILPKSRGTYVIGNFDIYTSLKYDDSIKPIKLSLPNYIKSIEPSDIYSESIALNSAYCAGAIDSVLGEKSLPTVCGRMSTGNFNFFINTLQNSSFNISVTKSQCEIDAGFESKNSLALLEAKNTSCSDFLIRQLYYPFRLWNRKSAKKVRPIFMTYSNDIYSFFEYDFINPKQYNSLKLIKQSNYIITSDTINSNDILSLIKFSQNKGFSIEDPIIPFPQCDSFIRIFDFLSILYENDLSFDDVTSNYDFTTRQTDYYFNGARYLNLAEKYKNTTTNEIFFKLTPLGHNIMSLSHKDKVLSLSTLILSHKVFCDYMIKLFLTTNDLPKFEIVKLMKNSNINVVSDSTFERRASTVSSWCRWIYTLIDN